MKTKATLLLLCLLVALWSCQQDAQEKATPTVSPDIISLLQRAGFDTSEGLSHYRDGYLIEYDIFLTEKQIRELAEDGSPQRHPDTEHYRTNNLVTSTPRTLLVYMDTGFGSYMQSAFDNALSRYNALGLGLTFQRTTNASAANISILSFYEVSNVLGFSAGFPSGGNPASPIRLNTYYYNNSSSRTDAATVIAHEIGHAIGFRHTDYMNRAFSCGVGGNEGDAGVGALPIPGTPSGPSANSWMLACSSNTDRPFTSEDIVALTTVYPGSIAGDPAPIGSVIALRAVVNNSYVAAENAGAEPLIANRTGIGLWEQFLVVDAGGGAFALQAVVNGQYVCADNAGSTSLIANRTGIGLWEQFRWKDNGDGTISIQAAVNNQYVCAENAGATALIANRGGIGTWEKFYWEVVN